MLINVWGVDNSGMVVFFFEGKNIVVNVPNLKTEAYHIAF